MTTPYEKAAKFQWLKKVEFFPELYGRVFNDKYYTANIKWVIQARVLDRHLVLLYR
jgi:hypothetical protein